MTRVFLFPVAPYDLVLSSRVAGSFAAATPRDANRLRFGVRIRNTPKWLELRTTHRNPLAVEVRTPLSDCASDAKRIAGWMIFADLDLRPFYRIADEHPILGAITGKLEGLKPTRPASLFDMLVIAITEQQISLAAAHRIRARILERFGERVDGLFVFPSPDRLADASLEDLLGCGLSQRKVEYIRELSQKVAAGDLDLSGLKDMTDEEVHSLILRQRGLGRWSADYVLIRRLGRLDRVPSEDPGARSVVGRYLGRGKRLLPVGVMRELSPFSPYRGLAAFFLLAHSRLTKMSAESKI